MFSERFKNWYCHGCGFETTCRDGLIKMYAERRHYAWNKRRFSTCGHLIESVPGSEVCAAPSHEENEGHPGDLSEYGDSN